MELFLWINKLLTLPARVREKLRRLVHGTTLTTPTFEQLLKDLGFTPGATVLLHSSMNALHHHVPQLSPLEMIQMMLRLLGDQGTLLMPAFPFHGRQWSYMQESPVFNVQKSSSRMGLLTEVFRRMAGVQRSQHPTHSLCGLGPNASRLLETHHLGGPFDKLSPFALLMDCDGLEVGLGVQIESYSGLGVALEQDEQIKARVFHSTPQPMVVINGLERFTVPVRPIQIRWSDQNMHLLSCIGAVKGVFTPMVRQGLRCATARCDQLNALHHWGLKHGLFIFQETPPAGP